MTDIPSDRYLSVFRAEAGAALAIAFLSPTWAETERVLTHQGQKSAKPRVCSVFPNTIFFNKICVPRPTSQAVYKFLWMNVSLCKDENGKMLNCINIYNRAVAGKMYNSPKLLISHTPVRCDKDVNFLN